jgi:hypothetical protein
MCSLPRLESAGQQEVIVKAWFEGDFEGFKKTHANAYFCNVIKYLTKGHPHKINKFCEGIPGVHPPHTLVKGFIELAHPKGSDRHAILRDILTTYTDNEIIRCDIFVVEAEFVRRHKSMIADGSCKFLCPDGNKLWGN